MEACWTHNPKVIGSKPIAAILGDVPSPRTPCFFFSFCYSNTYLRPCGAMDNASAYGAEDSRFESWQARIFHGGIRDPTRSCPYMRINTVPLDPEPRPDHVCFVRFQRMNIHMKKISLQIVIGEKFITRIQQDAMLSFCITLTIGH